MLEQKRTAASGRTLEEEVAAAGRQQSGERRRGVEEFDAVCAFYCSAHAGYAQRSRAVSRSSMKTLIECSAQHFDSENEVRLGSRIAGHGDMLTLSG